MLIKVIWQNLHLPVVKDAYISGVYSSAEFCRLTGGVDVHTAVQDDSRAFHWWSGLVVSIRRATFHKLHL